MINPEKLKYITDTFFYGNRNVALEEMKELKKNGGEEEFINHLEGYIPSSKYEVLSYFFKHS